MSNVIDLGREPDAEYSDQGILYMVGTTWLKGGGVL